MDLRDSGKKVTGTICAKHPPGRSGKWCLSPFFPPKLVQVHLAWQRCQRSGPVEAKTVVGPEGAVQICPALDGVHLVGRQPDVLVGLAPPRFPQPALDGAEGHWLGDVMRQAPLQAEIVDPALTNERAVGGRNPFGVDQ